jgi:HAMP domain-containing protein
MGAAASLSEFAVDGPEHDKVQTPKTSEARQVIGQLLAAHGMRTRDQLLALEVKHMVLKKRGVTGAALLRQLHAKMLDLRDDKPPKRRFGFANVVLKAQARVKDLLEGVERRRQAVEKSHRAACTFVVAFTNSVSARTARTLVLDELMTSADSLIMVHAVNGEAVRALEEARAQAAAKQRKPLPRIETDFFKQHTEVEMMTHPKMPRFRLEWVTQKEGVSTEACLLETVTILMNALYVALIQEARSVSLPRLR